MVPGVLNPSSLCLIPGQEEEERTEAADGPGLLLAPGSPLLIVPWLT